MLKFQYVLFQKLELVHKVKIVVVQRQVWDCQIDTCV